MPGVSALLKGSAVIRDDLSEQLMHLTQGEPDQAAADTCVKNPSRSNASRWNRAHRGPRSMRVLH